MNLEQMLTDELRTVADGQSTPPPPAAAELVRLAGLDRARSRRTRLAATVLVAAAVVAAIVFGTRLGPPSAAPRPTHPTTTPTALPTALPTGAPPAIPFIKNDKLYVDGHVQRGSWSAVFTTGAASVAYLDDMARDETGTIALFHDGSEVARVAHVARTVISPGGSKVAWLERDGTRWFVVAYDLVSRKEQGRVAVDAHDLGHVGKESEAWESLSAVDDAGVVTWGGVLKTHTWTPGSAPIESAPAEPGTTSGDFPIAEGQVTLSPDGRWGAWTVDRTGDQAQGTTETPDQWKIGVFAQRPGDPSSRVQFRLPRNTPASVSTWETNDSLLLQVFEDPTGISWHYVRCSIATQECEVAPTP